MSKVALSGNASGTGTFTIASPNSNTDRTLTLPDQTGTVITANGSNQLVAPASGILFADATTQTTAASLAPSSISAIGSVVLVANTTASNLTPGGTIAGSSLYYPSTITQVTSFVYTEGTSTAPLTYFRPGLNNISVMTPSQRTITGNTGYTVPGGHTALSGTWRVLSIGVARSSSYDSTYNVTTSTSYYLLAQRIS